MLRHLTDEQLKTRAWYVVYRLIDPLNSQVRYVGQTCSHISLRLNGHCSTPTSGAMGKWIFTLKTQGLKPLIEVIEEGLTEVQAERQEKYWIEIYRSQGHPLLNVYPKAKQK